MRQKIIVFILFLSVTVFFKNATATELQLSAQNDQGQSIPISSAELLLVYWGDTERIPLEIQDGKLTLHIDEGIFSKHWPDKIFLYLKSEGYVDKRSESITWIRSEYATQGLQKITEAKFPFLNELPVIVKQNDKVEAKITFRKPIDRYLKLLDEQGNVLPNLSVTAYMFWSKSNHCGVLSGADKLGKFNSDVSGMVKIPDGDFEYVFEFECKRAYKHYVLKNPQSAAYPSQLITCLPQPQTTIVLHKLHHFPLKMQVTRMDKPAAGVKLTECIAACPCGACCGTLATTDKQGEIYFPEFYPEETESLSIHDKNNNILWEADPRNWIGDLIKVELPVPSQN